MLAIKLNGIQGDSNTLRRQPVLHLYPNVFPCFGGNLRSLHPSVAPVSSLCVGLEFVCGKQALKFRGPSANSLETPFSFSLTSSRFSVYARIILGIVHLNMEPTYFLVLSVKVQNTCIHVIQRESHLHNQQWGFKVATMWRLKVPRKRHAQNSRLTYLLWNISFDLEIFLISLLLSHLRPKEITMSSYLFLRVLCLGCLDSAIPWSLLRKKKKCGYSNRIPLFLSCFPKSSFSVVQCKRERKDINH